MAKVKFRNNALSARERRRIGAREQAKAQRREALDAFNALSPEERAQRIAEDATLQRIQRNGITVDDLERTYKTGYDEGFRLGCEHTFESLFAAACLALHELHGFGAKRCLRVLNLMHEKTYYCLSRTEIIQEVYDKMKLTINFRDNVPGEIVERNEGK